eukprot:TRINITY_DN57415_c0_g1_i1.p1 TRINITY_DN57415_c0_g1~~TRINITY_DN57415_c0_g1_i1.p1  ORF type:complete len:371 (+),score=99.93 TRINITY_DN57415_c0_g1_i1:89-1201(+)
MGKGKTKGWRPPAADSAEGFLLGSAAALTGDTIASPVQLRQEGREVPKDHINYGWTGSDGWGKGKGKQGKDSATGANNVPVSGKSTAPVPGSGAGASPKHAGVAAKPTAKGAAPTPKADVEAPMPPPKAPAPKEEPKIPSFAPSKPVADDGKSEIERRREALMAHRKAISAANPERALESEDYGEDNGAAARRAESQAKREEMEARIRDAEARRVQALPGGENQNGHPKIVKEEVKMEENTEATKGTDVKTEAPKKEEIKEEVTGDEPAAKRLRAEPVTSCPDASSVSAAPVAPAAKAPAAAQGATISQQGLQHWAERVNEVAGGDAELLKRCRDFVRKRILKAHATGSLHTTSWDEEPLPTVDALHSAT